MVAVFVEELGERLRRVADGRSESGGIDRRTGGQPGEDRTDGRNVLCHRWVDRRLGAPSCGRRGGGA